MKTKLAILLGTMFTAILLGMIGLRVAACATEQTEPTLTVPNATGTSVALDRVTDFEQTVKEIEGQRNRALREAELLGQKLSRLLTSRIRQLEADVARGLLESQGSEERIKELEDDRHEAARQTRQALEKLVEELGS